mmetsp:Transcript_45726/g.145676  ORF Transcript_45726/g.145676 Transcript_45726/m.145676 type:complete len:296 (+) Transcript_45726:2636-3523(+)
MPDQPLEVLLRLAREQALGNEAAAADGAPDARLGEAGVTLADAAADGALEDHDEEGEDLHRHDGDERDEGDDHGPGPLLLEIPVVVALEVEELEVEVEEAREAEPPHQRNGPLEVVEPKHPRDLREEDNDVDGREMLHELGHELEDEGEEDHDDEADHHHGEDPALGALGALAVLAVVVVLAGAAALVLVAGGAGGAVGHAPVVALLVVVLARLEGGALADGHRLGGGVDVEAALGKRPAEAVDPAVGPREIIAVHVILVGARAPGLGALEARLSVLAVPPGEAVAFGALHGARL